MKTTSVWSHGIVVLLAAGAGGVSVSACNELTGADQFVESPCYPLPPSQCGTADGGPDADATTDAEAGGDGPAADSTVVSDAGGGEAASDSGRAEAGCPAGELACDGGCVANDPHNCGACGHDCTMLPNVSGQVACGAGGVCEFDAGACAPSYAHCGDGGPNAGCETQVSTATNCGACGIACSGGMPDCSGSGKTYSCASGCPAGMTACGTTGTTCTDTTNDRNNCGSCGTVCTTQVAHATPSCSSSMCGFTCNGGYQPCNGGCADYQTDNGNCGSCGKACTGGQVCSGGTCGCPAGTLDCKGTCEAPGPQNGCGAGGACGGACSGPTAGTGAASCNGTSCALSCSGSTPDQCGTACVDTNTDGNNCGMCSHSCLGGGCIGGKCQPTVLVPATTSASLPGVTALTTNGATVFWVNQNMSTSGLLLSCADGGCGMNPFTVTSTSGSSSQILANSGTVYWSAGPVLSHNPVEHIFSCTTSGCTSAVSIVGQSPGIASFATSGATLYWSGTNAATQPAIMMCSPGTSNSCAAPTQFVLANAIQMAFQGGALFWADSSTGNVLACAPSSAGGACAGASTISASRPSPTVLAVDGTNIYWSDNDGIMQCPAGGCGSNSPIALAGPQVTFSIAADGAGHVYWVASNELWRATAGAAGSAAPIAQPAAGPVGVGEKAMYWSVAGGGVMMLAR